MKQQTNDWFHWNLVFTVFLALSVKDTIDNLDRMTFSPTKDIALDLSKKMQTQVSDDGNGYTSGKIYSYSSYLDGLMYIEDV